MFKRTRYLTRLNLLRKNAITAYENFQNVIENLKDGVIGVENLKRLVQINNAAKCDLAFMKLRLSELSINLTNLEALNSELLESINVFRKTEDILTSVPGPDGKKKLKTNLCM